MYIDITLQDVDIDFSDEATCCAIENLLLSSSQGNHLVAMPPALLEGIQDCIEFSWRVRGEAKRVLANWSEIRGLRSALQVVLCIDKVSGKITNAPGEKKWTAPLHVFADPMCVRPVRLVLEDIDDKLVYVPMIEDVVRRRYGNVYVKVDLIHGGGSGSAKVMKHQVESDDLGMVISIVDSDKDAPNDDIGGTANAVHKATLQCRSSGWLLCDRYITSAHSVESFISSNAWQCVLKHSQKAILRSNEQRILRLMEVDPEVWRYVDWKNGATMGRYLESNLEVAQYWKGIIQGSQKGQFRNSCRETGQCERGTSSCCCSIIRKCGSSILNVARTQCMESFYVNIVKPHGPIKERHVELGKFVSEVAQYSVAMHYGVA